MINPLMKYLVGCFMISSSMNTRWSNPAPEDYSPAERLPGRDALERCILIL